MPCLQYEGLAKIVGLAWECLNKSQADVGLTDKVRTKWWDAFTFHTGGSVKTDSSQEQRDRNMGKLRGGRGEL